MIADIRRSAAREWGCRNNSRRPMRRATTSNCHHDKFAAGAGY
ncbi:hypothetical protein [Ensifer sp. PDNC004]|nr:hypothetical protein [Ensifer sp. PDNC004]